ncbi:MAG: hypothetical protein ACHQ7N_01945 [Candidatus Methylomirabilales bacterium]
MNAMQHSQELRALKLTLGRVGAGGGGLDRVDPAEDHRSGILQAYIERVMGLGFMTAQAQMRFWFAVTWVLGLILLVGVVLTVVDLLTLRPAPHAEERA